MRLCVLSLSLCMGPYIYMYMIYHPIRRLIDLQKDIPHPLSKKSKPKEKKRK